MPATRPNFWRMKFDSNIKRDAATQAFLEDQGWRVATVWECALRRNPMETLEALSAWIDSGARSSEFGAPITMP